MAKDLSNKDLPILDDEEGVDNRDLPILDDEPATPGGPGAVARQIGGTVADIARESIGPSIGAALGAPLGPVGIGAGAAAGRAVQEVIESPEKTKTDIAIESAMEPVYMLVGGAVGKGIGKVAGPALRPIGKAIKGAGRKIKSAFLKLNKQFPDLTPDELKIKAVRDFRRTTGLSEALGERVIDRHPTVLSRKNLTSAAPDVELMKKASRVWDETMDHVGKQFDREVKPLLETAEKMPQVNAKYHAFKERIIAEGLFGRTSNTKTAADKFVPGLMSDPTAAAAMNAVDKKMAIFRASPTALRAHELKKVLNDALSQSAFKDQSGSLNAAGKALVGFKQEVLEELSTAVPGYRNQMNNFRSLFEFENAYGTKLKPENVHNLFSDLLNDQNSVLRESINDFMVKFPPSKRILNDAWDNVAGTSLIAGQIKVKPTSVGAHISGTPIGIRLTKDIVPEREAQKLATKALRGFETRPQAALKAVGGVTLGQTVKRSLTSVLQDDTTPRLSGEANPSTLKGEVE
jgi:hypothetical protein